MWWVTTTAPPSSRESRIASERPGPRRAAQAVVSSVAVASGTASDELYWASKMKEFGLAA